MLEERLFYVELRASEHTDCHGCTNGSFFEMVENVVEEGPSDNLIDAKRGCLAAFLNNYSTFDQIWLCVSPSKSTRGKAFLPEFLPKILPNG